MHHLLFTFFLLVVAFAGAFQHCNSHRSAKISSLSSTSSNIHQEVIDQHLELACEAVTKFGLCDPTQLNELADKVEAGADSCIFHDDDEVLCEKEIEDRKDVADVLRMQAELQLRMEAIRGSSLFTSDIISEKLIHQRDELLEILGEDGV